MKVHVNLLMTENDPKLSVLLPVRNDGVNICIMLKMLKAVVEVPFEVLVIHDQSDDDSVEIVDGLGESYPGLRRIHNKQGVGVIYALKAGMAAARGELVLVFAADEVGPVLAIEEMLGLMEQGCDFVSCTRYAYGGRRLGGSLIGGILSRIANRMFRLLSGTRFTDCTTGIKMFRRDVFERLNLEARPVGWAVAFEMAMKAQSIGLKLGEVPIISIDRLYGGQSTFKLRPWCMEYSRWFFWGIRHLRFAGKRPTEVMVHEPAIIYR